MKETLDIEFVRIEDFEWKHEMEWDVFLIQLKTGGRAYVNWDPDLPYQNKPDMEFQSRNLRDVDMACWGRDQVELIARLPPMQWWDKEPVIVFS